MWMSPCLKNKANQQKLSDELPGRGKGAVFPVTADLTFPLMETTTLKKEKHHW